MWRSVFDVCVCVDCGVVCGICLMFVCECGVWCSVVDVFDVFVICCVVCV